MICYFLCCHFIYSTSFFSSPYAFTVHTLICVILLLFCYSSYTQQVKEYLKKEFEKHGYSHNDTHHELMVDDIFKNEDEDKDGFISTREFVYQHDELWTDDLKLSASFLSLWYWPFSCTVLTVLSYMSVKLENICFISGDPQHIYFNMPGKDLFRLQK